MMADITPKGKQKEVMALPAKGHFIVLGAAGSGKTTIALLRAQHLANLPGNDKVLLVTFNRALVQYIRGINNNQSPKLFVENYHKFARDYLDSKGKMPENGILNSYRKKVYIESALEFYKKHYPAESTLKRPKEFFVDEITFIEKFGFADFTAYYDAERIGRAAANIRRENRIWVFEVYKKYIELRKADGIEYDWDDLALYVYRELQSDTTARIYTHIIIDEGQDFSPMMIKSLVSAFREGGSLTFFGDVAQQIHGNRLSWRDSGINVNKVWRFDVNYRNPATITAFANDIIKSEYWQQNDDMVTATNQIAEGPKPILVKFKDKAHEINWVVKKAIDSIKFSSVVIVCRRKSDIDSFMSDFKNHGCNAMVIDKDTSGYTHTKTVYLTTFHSVKGLEFDYVFVPLLLNNIFPDTDAVANAVTKEEAYSNEIKLLYVAVTRSKGNLYMSYHGTLSSLFPETSQNYDKEYLE